MNSFSFYQVASDRCEDRRERRSGSSRTSFGSAIAVTRFHRRNGMAKVRNEFNDDLQKKSNFLCRFSIEFSSIVSLSD